MDSRRHVSVTYASSTLTTILDSGSGAITSCCPCPQNQETPVIQIKTQITHNPTVGFAVSHSYDLSTATPKEMPFAKTLEIVFTLGLRRVNRILAAYNRGEQDDPTISKEMEEIRRELGVADQDNPGEELK